MHFVNDRIFERQYKKLSRAVREKVSERLHVLTAEDEFHSLLNNHKLNPPFVGYRSINVTGDYRLVYKRIDHDTWYLRAVGTHHQLFGT